MSRLNSQEAREKVQPY